MGWLEFWAMMPAMPGPRPNPSRNASPATTADHAFSPGRAWSTMNAVPTPRKLPIASPWSTRPANSISTLLAQPSTIAASAMLTIAGAMTFLRPTRSETPPITSIVGTTVSV